MPLPEDTVYTPMGKTPEIKAQLDVTEPPKTANRVRPFVVFLKTCHGGKPGQEVTTKRPMVFDLGRNPSLAMVQYNVIHKRWPIIAYRLVEDYKSRGIKEDTWEGKPVLNEMRAEIEALAMANGAVIEAKDREISSLREQLEEHERSTTKSTKAKRSSVPAEARAIKAV